MYALFILPVLLSSEFLACTFHFFSKSKIHFENKQYKICAILRVDGFVASRDLGNYLFDMRNYFWSMFRRVVEFKAKPTRDLVSSGTPFPEWKSIGETPTFDLESEQENDFVPCGWVYIESKILRRGACLVARLNVDIEGASGAENSFVLPVTRTGNIKYLIKIPANASRFQFLPMLGEGVIRLDFIRITKISIVEKYIRMIDQVIGDILKFKGTLQARLYNLKWRRLFFDLDGIYAACAHLRFHFLPLNYDSYITDHDVLSQADIDAIERHMISFRSYPLFSILIDVRNSSVDDLRRSVESVSNQIYRNWELCIVVDGSQYEDVAEYFNSLSLDVLAINIVLREAEPGFSTALGDALTLVKGEYSIILYPGDLLAKQALYFSSLKINDSNEYSVIYADEDRVNENGERSAAYFKSDWNQDLFFSQDMISHAAAYKTSLLREIAIAVPASEVDRGRGYDIALQCVKRVDCSKIAHIPRVLYHRFQPRESLSIDSRTRDFDQTDRESALVDFFNDQAGVTVSKGCLNGTYRIQFPLPRILPKVTVVIPTRNGYSLLKKCVEGLLSRTDYNNLEIIIVDNQSDNIETINYLKYLAGIERFLILKYDFPFNYSSINNFAVAHASGDILCFLNDDVEAIESNWLSEMVSHALRPEIGVVGAKLLYPDNFVQHAGVVVGIGGFAGHVHKNYPSTHSGYNGRAVLVQNFSAVTGACFVIRRNLFLSIDGFDEKNLPVAFNDIDLCLRVRDAGYQILWTPYAVLYHYESYSRGDDQETAKKRARFNREKDFMVARWKTNEISDPFYSDNLTIDREDFTLANFPRISNPWSDFVDM